MIRELTGFVFILVALALGVSACQLILGFYGLEQMYNSDTVLTFLKGTATSKAVFATISAFSTAVLGFGMLLQPQS